jgi:hypothetical protein
MEGNWHHSPLYKPLMHVGLPPTSFRHSQSRMTMLTRSGSAKSSCICGVAAHLTKTVFFRDEKLIVSSLHDGGRKSLEMLDRSFLHNYSAYHLM